MSCCHVVKDEPAICSKWRGRGKVKSATDVWDHGDRCTGGCMLNLTDQNIAGSTAHLVTLQLNIPRNTSQYQLDILLGIFQLWFIWVSCNTTQWDNLTAQFVEVCRIRTTDAIHSQRLLLIKSDVRKHAFYKQDNIWWISLVVVVWISLDNIQWMCTN